MFRPCAIRQSWTAKNTKTSVSRVHGAAYTLGLPIVENQRQGNIQRLHDHMVRVLPGPRCGQRDLHIACTGENNGSSHLVVSQPSILGRIKHIFPAGIRAIQMPAQQGMDAPFIRQTFTGTGIPATAALPRVMGQIHMSSLVGKKLLHVSLFTGKM